MWEYRAVIPSSLRENLLLELHGNHLGIVKMKSLARSSFWWPGIDREIEQILVLFVMSQDQFHQKQSYTTGIFQTNKPWILCVHAEFFGPIGNKMYLIVIDSYSKFIEVVPMFNNITSSDTIKQMRKIFARYSLPLYFVIHNGPQWTSNKFAIFMSNNGVHHLLTAPFHPATKGAAENSVKSVKNCVKIALKNDLEMLKLLLINFCLTTKIASTVLRVKHQPS